MPANKQVGEIEFKIGKKAYVARVGTRELAILETKYSEITGTKVQGMGAIWRTANFTTYDNWVTFAQIALSRYHPDLTKDEVMDAILDYGEADGRKPAHEAITEAIGWSAPKVDPNDQPAATKKNLLELITS